MEIWSFNDFQIGFDQQIFRYWSRPQTLMRNDDWLLISRHRCTSHGRAKGAPFSSLKLVCRMTLYHDFALNIGILLYFILYNIMYKYLYIYIILHHKTYQYQPPISQLFVLVWARSGHEYFQRSQGSEKKSTTGDGAQYLFLYYQKRSNTSGITL